MKQTAVVVAPGRGTYNKTELGYLQRYHGGQADLIESFDALRRRNNQATLTELDGAARFSGARHTRGDTASGLIYTCAYGDFLAIDRSKTEIIGVTGNSMGWYIALACAGALSPLDGFNLVNTMGTLMQDHLIGGQLVYPLVDENWREIPGRRDKVFGLAQDLNKAGHAVSLSIDLGGMIVLAGDTPGLDAMERLLPRLADRFPMRLPNHAGFHAPMQEPVAKLGREALPATLFQQPDLPLIDGRGALWYPHAHTPQDIWDYTLGHQVVQPYNLALAIAIAARELMPDIFIVLGPGNTLGGAVAQSLVRANWRGLSDKTQFQAAQGDRRRLVSMGDASQRALVV